MTLNREFWHSGFDVTLQDVKYTAPAKPTPGLFNPVGKVVVQVKFENLGLQTSACSTAATPAVTPS